MMRYLLSHVMHVLCNKFFNICILNIFLTTLQLKRIYLISIGAMVIGGTESQKHSLSTTTMKRLLLGICWITKDLQIRKKSNNGDIICISEQQIFLGFKLLTPGLQLQITLALCIILYHHTL